MLVLRDIKVILILCVLFDSLSSKCLSNVAYISNGQLALSLDEGDGVFWWFAKTISCVSWHNRRTRGKREKDVVDAEALTLCYFSVIRKRSF